MAEACEHPKWDADSEARITSDDPIGPYLIVMVTCRDCEVRGEFSQHILNVVQDAGIEWADN